MSRGLAGDAGLADEGVPEHGGQHVRLDDADHGREDGLKRGGGGGGWGGGCGQEGDELREHTERGERAPGGGERGGRTPGGGEDSGGAGEKKGEGCA